MPTMAYCTTVSLRDGSFSSRLNMVGNFAVFRIPGNGGLVRRFFISRYQFGKGEKEWMGFSPCEKKLTGFSGDGPAGRKKERGHVAPFSGPADDGMADSEHQNSKRRAN